MKYTPVCLFTYNRLNETQHTIKALQKNFLAPESDLFIFSDGAKPGGEKKVNEVRQYLKNVSGFKFVKIFESPTNKGLANSIIQGVSSVIEEYGKVIVLEDDLITSLNFLDFMNKSLDFYQGVSSVFSISGYSFNLPSLRKYPYDSYLGHRASSWGWATWKNRWEKVDWEVKDYHDFKWNLKKQVKFMRGGSDMPLMLKRQMKGQIDSWAIRWCYDQFQKDMVTVFPSISKVKSIGFGDDATHTKNTNRFDTSLDNSEQREFLMDENPVLNDQLAKEFRQKFSILSRLKDKLP